MRIGTWNLEGRWDGRHLARVEEMDCDVLLLTEVSERVELPDHVVHPTRLRMAARRHWAAVASRTDLQPLPDPHGATSAAVVAGRVVCSSVLPWRGAWAREPWVGTGTAERTAAAVGDVLAARPSVWGGDWNHALSGTEVAGAKAGRVHVLAAVAALDLQVPTGDAPHQIPDLLSIDHVAVPAAWRVRSVEHHPAFVDGRRISDHDAYVVEVDPG